MDKCPFCGAEQDPDYPTTHYGCGQPIHPLKNIFRAPGCYERQLAAQTALLREALEIIQNGCSIIGWLNSDLYTLKNKAQALLPKLEEAVKEKV